MIGPGNRTTPAISVWREYGAPLGFCKTVVVCLHRLGH